MKFSRVKSKLSNWNLKKWEDYGRKIYFLKIKGVYIKKK